MLGPCHFFASIYSTLVAKPIVILVLTDWQAEGFWHLPEVRADERQCWREQFAVPHAFR